MPRRKKLSPEMEKVFDIKYAKDMAKGYDLKLTLKKSNKGTSLYAIKPIKKGNVIAYYKFMLYKEDDNFRGVNNEMYTMIAINKNDKGNRSLIGDIYEGSLEPPKYNIPYWGYFSNEPSGEQTENAYLDANLSSNYRKRDKIRAGETMIYKLLALRDIKPGEEITWCYGGFYKRDYKPNCDD
jgi:hypothetical protein